MRAFAIAALLGLTAFATQIGQQSDGEMKQVTGFDAECSGIECNDEWDQDECENGECDDTVS